VHWEKRIADWLIRHVAATPYDLVIKTGNRSETLAYTPTDWQLLLPLKREGRGLHDQALSGVGLGRGSGSYILIALPQ
jgi:hypothetical protein